MTRTEIQVLLLFGVVLLAIFLGYFGFPEHKYAAPAITGVLALVVGGVAVAGLNINLEEAQKLARRHAEKEAAEKTLKTAPTDAMATAQLNMSKLDEYYALNKSQASRSFLASIVAISVGFGVLIFSLWFANGDKLKSGAIGGALLQFIGGAFFVMYNKSLDQLNLFYGKLVQLQDTMLAVQQCELIQSGHRDRVREALINVLMSRHSIAKDVTPRVRANQHLPTARLTQGLAKTFATKTSLVGKDPKAMPRDN